MEAASAPPNSMVTIMIKNPNGSDQDFSLEVPLADTAIADVKRMLHEKHPEHPEPSTQRLIFAGKLLVDESLTADVLKQVSASANSSATPKEGSMAAMASPTNQKSSMNEPATDDPFAGL